MSKKGAVEEKTKQPAKEEKAQAPPEAEAEPEKKKTARPEKKKKVEKKIFTLYKVESDKVTRLRPLCERCGQGYFMAEHSDRYTCGHCGFTRYKPAENKHA